FILFPYTTLFRSPPLVECGDAQTCAESQLLQLLVVLEEVFGELPEVVDWLEEERGEVDEAVLHLTSHHRLLACIHLARDSLHHRNRARQVAGLVLRDVLEGRAVDA